MGYRCVNMDKIQIKEKRRSLGLIRTLRLVDKIKDNQIDSSNFLKFLDIIQQLYSYTEEELEDFDVDDILNLVEDMKQYLEEFVEEFKKKAESRQIFLAN